MKRLKKFLKRIYLKYQLNSVISSRRFCARLFFGEDKNNTYGRHACLEMYKKYSRQAESIQKELMFLD